VPLNGEQQVKVAIMGHADGIGRAIADAFRARGAEVVGLPPSSGNDLSAHRERIAAAAADCDVFVNAPDPHDPDTQIQLLFRLTRAWQGQDRTIVNLGSTAGERPVSGGADPHAVYMRALDVASQQLFNRADQRPRVVNIRPDVPDTAPAKDGQSRLSPEDVAKVVMWVIDQPRHVYISSVTLAHRETQGR
jgi:NADP-dependent 3-hydroxy acid dehydrogenase YdfG